MIRGDFNKKLYFQKKFNKNLKLSLKKIILIFKFRLPSIFD